MNVPTQRDSALFLLASFARSLSHKVRTPLSVLLSDLSYYESQLSNEDFSRTKEKCRDISRLLGSADFLSGTSTHVQHHFDLAGTLSEALGTHTEMAEPRGDAPVMIRANRNLMMGVFESIATLIGGGSGRRGWSQVTSIVTSDGEQFHCVLKGMVEHVPRGGGPIHVSSLTALYAGEWGLDCLEPPLIDSALWSQGMEIEVHSHHGEVALHIRGTLNHE